MALNKSSLLIRDYDTIRKVLRDIYIFGCFTRDDFIGMGISGRKYDNEQRRINAYLPKKFIKKRRVKKKILQYCSYKMEDSSKNYLAKTYRNKSFTLLDIMSYFFILQILGDGEEYTLSQLLEVIPVKNDNVEFTKDNLRNKLEELRINGLIIVKKKGQTVKYILSEDIWKNFSESELEEIYLYLEFLKNVLPMEIPYYFLQQKLKLYMNTERMVSFIDKNIFVFKHNHLFNSLDNEVLLECLCAIKQKRKIVLKRNTLDNCVEFCTIPIKVIHDSTYGRQYLMCFDIELKKCSTIRLDRIIQAICSDKLNEQEQQLIKEKNEIEKVCWCTSGMDKEVEEVKIRFHFDEEKEAFILNRIQREGHGGIIEKEREGQYLFTIKLRDPNEMIPWIRSFGERAEVISSGTYAVEKKIKEDWERAVKNYEALS